MGQELLTEIHLGSAQGRGKASADVQLAVIRALTAEDLPAIQAPPQAPGPVQLVKNIRYSHHRLAELIAKGMGPSEASLATGYAPAYISGIQRDPAFAELVAYYAEQTKVAFADSLERLKALGLDATEKLQDKLNDESVEWTKRELMELVELGLLGPMQAASAKGAQAQQPGANLSLEVRFVGAQPREGQTVEASFVDVTPEATSRG